MDAKQACDKLNGFNFQNRYLVGKSGGFFFFCLVFSCYRVQRDAKTGPLQFYITSQRKWPVRKRTSPRDKRI